MIAIIYPYRNRDLFRVKRSLDSWVNQSNQFFKIYFVNYGSCQKITEELKSLLNNYSFVELSEFSTQNQPWNKSRALNSVIKNLEEDYCFVADIDMIFHKDFFKKLNLLKDHNKIIYFKVGFLNKAESRKNLKFEDYNISFESTDEATGLSLFPVEALKEIRGFDEFFHFWGAEDTDIHNRLKLHGLTSYFYDKEILLLHQWHESYRMKESNKLTQDLRLNDVVRLNHEHMNFNLKAENIVRNSVNWGNPLNENEFLDLKNNCTKIIQINNTKAHIDHFVYHELSNLKSGYYCFLFKKNENLLKIKKNIKTLLGKSIVKTFTLKEINDKLLISILLINNYRNYGIVINDELNEIKLLLKIK